MRMRQTSLELERSFEEEKVVERARRQRLRREAVERTRVRRKAKVEKRQQLRFVLLLLSIVLTAVGVTIVMFETLAWLIG
jgi:hypothetical protein